MGTESNARSQELHDILDELISGSAQQLGPLGIAVDDFDTSDLTPDLLAKVNRYRKILQRYERELARLTEPDAPSTPHQALQDHPTPPTQPPATPAQKQTRRKRDKALDLLPLEALMQRAPGKTISQRDIQDLFEALEPDTKGKFASLKAKVGTYRSVKKWLNWSDPEDLHITPEGIEERNRLLAILRSQGRLPEIEEAFKKAWNVEVVIT